MKPKMGLLVTILLLFTFISGSAQAVIIDFEELSSLGSPWGSLSSQEYAAEGYSFSTNADSFDYATFYGPHGIALSIEDDTGTVQLTRSDSTTFDILSMGFISDAILGFSLQGTKSDGATIDYAIPTSGDWQYDEYALVDFTDLVSVDWPCDPDLHFDNITVIPEPTSILILIGATALAVRKHR